MQSSKIFLLLALSAFALLFFSPRATLALDCSHPSTPKEAIQCGSCDASGQTTCNKDATKSLNKTITEVINILSVIVGVVAVIMIILGGFRYITSAGSAEKISGAKNTLLYALIGLIIVALAQTIARFVLTNAAKS